MGHAELLPSFPPCFSGVRFSVPKRPTAAFCKPVSTADSRDDPVREWILTEGKATKITRITSVGGGCINLANRYDTDAGSFFVKTNRRIGPSMFEGEALGLSMMYATNSIRVPRPFKVGLLPKGGSYIIMEFIEFSSSWGNQSTIPLAGQRLMKSLHELFEDVVVEPSLLHGDLWSGNVSSDKNGEPVILDPACYYGHNEAEFGMSWCAGFGNSFYDAYFEVMPRQPGYEKRRDLYKLYHYLNHYNLFGSGYRSSSMSIIDNYLNMLKA